MKLDIYLFYLYTNYLISFWKKAILLYLNILLINCSAREINVSWAYQQLY